MPTRPTRSRSTSLIEKRLRRFLTNDETLRIAAYARALRLRRGREQIYKPRMELWDDGESPFVSAVFELPGLRPDDVSVDVVTGRLIVSGERRQPASPTQTADPSARTSESNSRLTDRSGVPQVRELKYGFFRRVVAVPVGCTTSHLEATLEHGMLNVSWPRQPLEQSLRQTPESGSSDKSCDVSAIPRFLAGNSSRSL